MSRDTKELDADMISNTLDMGVIRYSKVWEDSRILSEGLDISKEDTVLCITSSGDNVLNFLLHEPKAIYAVDLSVAQNALLELKMAAIKGLSSYNDYLELLGEKQSSRRVELFRQIQPLLPQYAKDIWEKNIKLIEEGLAWSGRFEKYVLTLGEVHSPKILNSAHFDEMFASRTIEEQREIFNSLPLEEFSTMFRWFASKEAVDRGRSYEQFKYVEQPFDAVGQEYWERLVKLCDSLHVADNFYLSWFLRGNRGYDPAARPDFAPPYLTEKGFNSLKNLVDRVAVCTGSVHEILLTMASKKFTKLSLSNIFEYISISAANEMFEIMSSTLVPGAVIAYFELLNPRAPSDNTKLKHLDELCGRLSPKGRVFWFNSHLRLYEVQ